MKRNAKPSFWLLPSLMLPCMLFMGVMIYMIWAFQLDHAIG